MSMLDFNLPLDPSLLNATFAEIVEDPLPSLPIIVVLVGSVALLCEIARVIFKQCLRVPRIGASPLTDLILLLLCCCRKNLPRSGDEEAPTLTNSSDGENGKHPKENPSNPHHPHPHHFLSNHPQVETQTDLYNLESKILLEEAEKDKSQSSGTLLLKYRYLLPVNHCQYQNHPESSTSPES
jgi:hypothetical protein